MPFRTRRRKRKTVHLNRAYFVFMKACNLQLKNFISRELPACRVSVLILLLVRSRTLDLLQREDFVEEKKGGRT